MLDRLKYFISFNKRWGSEHLKMLILYLYKNITADYLAILVYLSRGLLYYNNCLRFAKPWRIANHQDNWYNQIEIENQTIKKYIHLSPSSTE